MSRLIRLIVILILGWIILTPAWAQTSKSQNDKEHVLLISSYRKEMRSFEGLVDRISKILDEDPSKTISVEYLNSQKSASLDVWKSQMRDIIASYADPVSMVVIIGDEGWAAYRGVCPDDWRDIPVILSYIKRETVSFDDYSNDKPLESDQLFPTDYTFKGFKVAAVAFDYPIAENIELIKRLQPDVNELVYVYDGRFSTSYGRILLERELEQRAEKCKYRSFSGRDLTTYQLVDSLRMLPKESAVLMFSWLIDRDRNIYAPLILKEEMSLSMDRSLYMLSDRIITDSYFKAGCFYSLKNIAQSTIDLIYAVFRDGIDYHSGILASTYPPSCYLNYEQLTKEGIPQKNWPEGAIVINAPLSFWQQYKNESVWASALLVIVVGMLVAISRIRAKQVRVRAEQINKLNSLQSFLTSVIDFLPVGFFAKQLVDGAFIYKYWNKRIESMSGLSYEHVVGSDDMKLWEEQGAVYIEQDRELLGDQNFVTSIRQTFNTQTASRRIAQIIKRSLIQPDGSVYILGCAVDISKEFEDEQRLIALKEQAEASNRMKSSFLANMGHEIRTPLNAIVGFSDLISDPQIPDQEKEDYRRIIERNSSMLLQLINDVLDLAKLDSGHLDFTYSDIDLQELFEGLYSQYNVRMHEGVILEMELPNVRYMITSERRRLEQVLSNLISNAIKFTTSGSIKIGYKIEHTDSIYCFVTDTGAGLSEQQQSVFGRLANVDSHYIEDNGVGLSIAKSIITHLAGEIGVESVPEQGSTFWFRIPTIPIKMT